MHYQGSCHCGRIRFEVATEVPIIEACDCNCSMCRRRGGLLWFAPREAFALSMAEDDLATYTFHKHALKHHFCPTCGIATHSEGESPQGPMVAINVRCLPQVELGGLSITSFDGASR